MSPPPVKGGWGLCDGMCQILGQNSSRGSLQVVQGSGPWACPSWGYTYFTVNGLWFKKEETKQKHGKHFARNLIIYVRPEQQSVHFWSRAIPKSLSSNKFALFKCICISFCYLQMQNLTVVTCCSRKDYCSCSSGLGSFPALWLFPTFCFTQDAWF